MEKIKNREKKSAGLKKSIPLICSLILGVVCGIIIAEMNVETINDADSLGAFFIECLIGIILLFFAVLVQIIIHEGGHLLFGLMTGYQFSSFRIGSFMWLKTDGKLHLRRLSIAGTGGQCLMIPPEMQDGKIPYVLYNLGGSIMNLLTAVPAALLFLLYPDKKYISELLLEFACIGAGFAVLNGIPMHMGEIDNDGYNALSLGKNSEALRSFWIQMKVSDQITKGIRLKDMPEEWFEIPSEESMKNSMTAAMGVFACNRLMDAMEFEKADQTMKKLMTMETGIAGLYRNMMQIDRIYCELVGENRQEQLKQLLDKPLGKFIKTMKNNPSILRTRYASALLAENNPEKAQQTKKQFEKTARIYPHPGEIQAERELMEYAEKKIAEKT